MSIDVTYGAGAFNGILFPWGLGMFPSQITLFGVPAALARTGTVTVTDTVNGTTLTLPDCVLQDVGEVNGLTAYHLHDRRANLRGLPCHYEWNVPVSGSLLVREMPPQNMASQLLDDLGETGYDVSALPNDPRPYFFGGGQDTRDCLDTLCELLGCRPGLDLSNNITIYRLGAGAALPGSGEINEAVTYTLGNYPSTVGVEFAPTVYQSRLQITGVELNSFEDYFYTGLGVDLPSPWVGFPMLAPNEQDRKERSKYRFYYVSALWPNSGQLPGGAAFSFGDQLELFDSKISTFTTPSGSYSYRPPQVHGKFFAGNWAGTVHSTVRPYPYPFRIWPHANLVEFDRPVFKLDAAGNATACTELYLETSYQVRKAAGNLTRGSRTKAEAGDIARLAHLIPQPLQAVYVDAYDSAGAYSSTSNNLTAINALADDLIDAAEPGLLQRSAQVRRFSGVRQYAPDGINHQVTFAFGMPAMNVADGAPWTLFGRNCEPFGTETYAQRRARAKNR